VPFRDARESAHVRHLSVQVHRQHVRRVFRCGNVRRADIEVVVCFGNVDDNGGSTRLDHRLKCRRERHCWDDHSGARRESGGHQRQAEGVEAARDDDAMATPRAVGKLSLELVDGLSVREVPSIDRCADSVENALLHGTVRGTQVHERDIETIQGAGSTWASAGDQRVIAVRPPRTSFDRKSSESL
jgi:hypothetical protein